MKTYIVVDTNKGLFAPFERLKAKSFKQAMAWCADNGYDLIEEI